MEEQTDKLYCGRYLPSCLLKGKCQHCRADVGHFPFDAGHGIFLLFLLQLVSMLLHLQPRNEVVETSLQSLLLTSSASERAHDRCHGPVHDTHHTLATVICSAASRIHHVCCCHDVLKSPAQIQSSLGMVLCSHRLSKPICQCWQESHAASAAPSNRRWTVANAQRVCFVGSNPGPVMAQKLGRV